MLAGGAGGAGEGDCCAVHVCTTHPGDGLHSKREAGQHSCTAVDSPGLAAAPAPHMDTSHMKGRPTSHIRPQALFAGASEDVTFTMRLTYGKPKVPNPNPYSKPKP